jgi:hypothetical protein
MAKAESNQKAMTAQQYLLSQAEFYRRAAIGSADPFVVEELCRLAEWFELKARSLNACSLEDANLQKYAHEAGNERIH